MQLLGSMLKLRCRQLWTHLAESFPWKRVCGNFQLFSSELNVDQYDRNDENWTRGLKIFADPQFF